MRFPKAVYLLLCLSGFFSVGSYAFSTVPELPEDFKEWQIGIVMPSFYPVRVTKAYGVNHKQDWTVLMHNHMSFMQSSELETVTGMIPDYDGFGLPLAPGYSLLKQIGSTKQLPDTIYLYWASLYNQRFFVTEYTVPKAIKEKMLIGYPISYNETRSCYETYLYFGLLPNGHAKVWQGGCNRFSFIEEVPPTLELDKDSKGHTADAYYRDFYGAVVERAQKAGVKLDPIPWEKLNKVFIYDKQKAIDAYLERMKTAK